MWLSIGIHYQQQSIDKLVSIGIDWYRFTNFFPRVSQKMADDRTGSVRDVCSRLLSQSIVIDERFLCGYQSTPIK